MSALYRTRDGDTVDWICWRHYGTASGPVEAVLDANPGLAAYGPSLPAGLLITLPDRAAPAAASVVRIWD
ncbi:phage tail protein [Roseospira marina]|uniref:Phage tail protein n=1 Tax=Roseospira marina TaxID=140057 RepID=A0A5M6IGZ5_9PROT|nr:tail protein X [Roseospira marina]KAA5606838.1 phage tail protein [Roseospira marina]MBB4313000.1 phage tail protein X [Roseospira marina]MBB5086227.1 phage tail protein X [Roseospira marina]